MADAEPVNPPEAAEAGGVALAYEPIRRPPPPPGLRVCTRVLKGLYVGLYGLGVVVAIAYGELDVVLCMVLGSGMMAVPIVAFLGAGLDLRTKTEAAAAVILHSVIALAYTGLNLLIGRVIYREMIFPFPPHPLIAAAGPMWLGINALHIACAWLHFRWWRHLGAGRADPSQ